MGAIDYECREAIRRLVSMLDDPNGFHDAELAHVLVALDAPAPDPAPDAAPAGRGWATIPVDRGALGTDERGNWRKADPPPPALPATCPFCGKRPFRRVQYRDRKWHVWCFDCGANGPEADSEADALATWARAMPPMLDAETRALMLDARMAVLGYRDTIRRGSSPEASSFRDRMDALASALRAAAGPTP